jgi:hypothetical protein
MLGRPIKSKIRQNLIELLYFMKSGYGYDIFKSYIEIFPRATMRSIYYNLNKGIKTKEFEVEKIEKSQGDYSWGPEAEKIYYRLGPNAKVKIDLRIKRSLERVKKSLIKKNEQ